MASYTPNLDLLKKSPVTDGDDMFNVETMLNENWDRIDRGVGDYTTPAQKMGLTGDLSVGASLGVLANIGNVHVWRKTVKTDEKIPATYSLGPEEGKAALTYPQTPSTQASFHYGKTITVDDNGTITINGEQTLSLNSDDSSVQKGNNLKGNFFYCDPSSTIGGENEFETGPGNVYFIPSDATISREPDTYLGGVIYTSKYQEVRAVPAVPPGTHVTYLTSVNRNAYQEGDDAKEAGYALGRIVKVTLGMSNTNDGTGVDWRYSDSVVVNSDGVVSLGGNPTQLILASWDTPDVCDVLKGKFACPVTTGSRFSTNEVVFFPNDTVFSKSSVSGGHVAINAEQYQIVTGSPAIPAGTTIEYLGVLGDPGKQIVFGEFIGDNTAGREIKLGFKPSMVVLIPHSYINLRIDLGTTDTPFWCMVPGCDYETSAYPLSEEYMYITEKGFIVSYDSDASEIYWNQQYKSYYYLALE